MERPDAVATQRSFAADIACELADVLVVDQNSTDAVRYYQEALMHEDKHHKVWKHFRWGNPITNHLLNFT